MSSSKKTVRYIYNLPYPQKRELQQLLDADGKWEELGGRFMNLNQIKLALIGKAVYSRESPTNLLLEQFGQRNGTVDELFIMLNKMEHYRAMAIIVSYVNPKYQHLLQDNVPGASALFQLSTSKGSPQPTAPNQHLLSEQNGSRKKESIKETAAMALDCTKGEKFEADPSNFNHSVSDQSILQPKIPGMAAHRNKISSSTQKMISSNEESETYNVSSVTGIVGPPLPAERDQSKNEKQIHKISNGIKKLNIPMPPPQGSSKRNPKTLDEATTSSATSAFAEDLPLVMRIPHKVILKGTDNFDESRILGRGGFGIVYKGQWKEIPVAIKRLLPKNKQEAGNTMVQQISLNQSLTELKILHSCRIDNILPLYGVSLEGPEPCLVYQYMINGSLEDRLLCKGNTAPLNWLQRASIVDGTARGLNYLHSLPDKPLVHGDIKSANILLDSDMKAKIGDFGLAREGPASQYTHLKVSAIHGTQVYLPPEYLRQSLLSPKVDVFSYGIVLLEVATGQRAINDRRTKNKYLREHVEEMVKSNQTATLQDTKAGTEGIEWFEEILKIGQKCCQSFKKQRPEMAEVLHCFEQVRDTINMAARMRRFSKEMVELPIPNELSPMELQLWYDIRNGPNFMPPPDQYHGRSDAYQFGYNQFMPPQFNPVPLNLSPPPTYSSFQASQIREPPSLTENSECPPLYFEESSCVATAGSSNYEGNSPPSIDAQNETSYSSDSVPILTMLGTKPPSGGITTDLGPTPHPSGILSDLPLCDDDSSFVRTPKLTSDFNLDSDSDD